MAIWSSNNIMLTQKGQELLSKVQAGVGQLAITKVVTGSGRVSASNLFSQTDVSSPKQAMAVTKVTTMSTGSNLELQVTNTNLSESYNINQIGVYATHPDMGEVLYMIAQCDEGTADIMPLPSVTPVTMNFMFYLIHSSETDLNITVDPAGLVSVGTFNEHLADFQDLCDFVGYNDEQIYGVEIDYENATYTRLGANVGLKPSDFDNLAPWGGRRRCNITDDGVVVAYYGEQGYTETGALTESIVKDGVTYPKGTFVQVMVEQPKFWYKTIPVKTEKQANQSGYSLCKARYYISLAPRPGFKLFPLFTRGIPLRETDVAYLPAYRGSIYDVSTPSVEVVGMGVLNSPTTDGNITLIMDTYGETKVIPVSANDSAEDVAAKIAALQFNDWVLYREGAAIQFTAKRAGAKSKCVFEDTDNTGTFCYFDYSSYQAGAGGYVENDTPVVDLTISTGDKLCSIAGVKPASGFEQKYSRSAVSILAKNRNYNPETQLSRFADGFGWQQKDLSALHCTIWLHLIEYATLDCQSTIGSGVTRILGDTGDNMTYKNGDTAFLGNASGSAPGEDGLCSISYRGEENAWGNGCFWLEGLNIKPQGVNEAFFSVTGIYTDSVGEEQEGYKSVGFSLAKLNGYADRVGYSEEFDWGFLATRTTGSSNKPTHDYFSQKSANSGWIVAAIGGTWNSGSQVGLCSFAFHHSPTAYSRTFSSSLLFVPEPKGTPVTQ